MLDVFFREEKDYTSQLNPIKGYVDQLAYFISVKKGISLEDARVKAIEFTRANFKDRNIKYFEREENGDRVVKNSSLLTYITENIKNKSIIAPTLTTYLNADVKKSILSRFVIGNVKKRSKAKKEAQQAKAEGNYALANSKNNEQNNMKIYNNALSGIFGQKASSLYNPTAHNTLTSLTRTITSISNASNERLLAGNKYFPRPQDVFKTIVYISTYTNKQAVKEAMDKYGIRVLSVDEVVASLKYSSDLYFSDDSFYRNKIIPYLELLDPYVLSNIAYSGDLYHIRKFNDDLVRRMMSRLIETKLDKSILTDHKVIYSIPEPVLYFAHSSLASHLKGYGKDYEAMNKDGVAAMVYNTSLNIIEVIKDYGCLFRAFFMNGSMPTNSFRLNNMLRRVVVLSDTDSTCFSVDEWVTWYKKEFVVDDESIGLGGAMAYIASQAIVNTLAELSSCMNIAREHIFTLAMKNEFLWTLHSPCEISKHYYAYTVIQEGNVFLEPEVEIKGVHLKNSAVAVGVTADAKDMMTDILSTLHNNKKINLTSKIKHVIELEKTIIKDVVEGGSTYLKNSKIKDKSAYTQDEFRSPYHRHVLWDKVFAPKYGYVDPPPYDVNKLPTTVTSRPELVKWLESIEDLALRERLAEWLKQHNKTSLPTIYLSQEHIKGSGIPKELLDIVNIRQIVFDTTMQHRTILETLGVLVNKELLISEQFKF